MRVIDLETRKDITSKDKIKEQGSYFVFATEQQLQEHGALFLVTQCINRMPKGLADEIRYDIHPNFSCLSFLYHQLKKDNTFVFTPLHLYYTRNAVIFIYEQDNDVHAQLIEEFDQYARALNRYEPAFVFYNLLSLCLANMFEAICAYENVLTNMEDDIILGREDYDVETLAQMKSNTYDVKRNMRLLLYVGDMMVANENHLFTEEWSWVLRNLDVRINKVYEYADNVHELSEHIMEINNSAVNEQTNALINRLTIFTVFATPLTVLTGIYGMNFVNMPELQHPYGYFILLGIMLAVIFITYLILKKKDLI